MKTRLKILASMAGFTLPVSVAGQLVADKLPNIVIIEADDLGFGDLSCYGATRIKTPGMDRVIVPE